MKFNTKESFRTEQWLYGIPMIAYALCQMFIQPLPNWCKYAFSAYLLVGFIYFGFLHKANKME